MLDSDVSRIDTFRNVVAEENFLSYSNVFKLLDVPRKHIRDYGTTFLFKNTQEQICIYDKLEEMLVRKKNISFYPKNTIRFENRLMNKRKVSKCTGISKAGDIIKCYSDLKEYFHNSLKNNLFKYSAPDVNSLTIGYLQLQL